MLVEKVKVIYADLSYKIFGILFKVRKNLGQFRNEQQYCDAIEKELSLAGGAIEREKILPPSFSSERKGRNKAAFLIDSKILLEVKAKTLVTKEDYYQVRRYLEALRMKLGIIVNMRRYSINPKRILNSKVSMSAFA